MEYRTGATGTAFYVDSTEIGTSTLTSGQATYTTAALAVGTHTVYAVYEGDSAYSSSDADDLTVVISSTLTATISIASVSASTVSYGTAVVLTATVDISAATGTVTFYDNMAGSPVALGTASLNDGVATLSFATLAVGSHAIYATYVATAYMGLAPRAVLRSP